MNQTSLREATVILRALLTAVLAAPSDRTSSAAGALRAAVGALSTNAAAEIAGFSVGVDTVRAAAASRSAVSALGGVVADAVALQALACECRIIGDTDFVSRDQVDACRQTLMDAFDATIDKAADAFDQVTVQALIGLRAAVVRDLTARARPLPQMINYATPVRMPALWLAQRLYADAARALDLIAENGAVHPLFMPAAGRALSR
jgi:prophage DNA circulation protein